jgi:hypothetical protein
MNLRAFPIEAWRDMGLDLGLICSGIFSYRNPGLGLRFDFCVTVPLLGSLRPAVSGDFIIVESLSFGLFFSRNYSYCKLSNSSITSSPLPHFLGGKRNSFGLE